MGNHNCNFFTNELCEALGVPGLDQEYLDCSNAGKLLGNIPGGASVQEAWAKWPIDDKRMDEAFMKDLERFARLPADVIRETVQFLGVAASGAKDFGGRVANARDRLLGK